MGKAKARRSSITFSPANVAPLVAWLGSDDAKDVHGEVFRVGLGSSVADAGLALASGRITQEGDLGSGRARRQVKEELAKGVTKKESMATVLAGGSKAAWQTQAPIAERGPARSALYAPFCSSALPTPPGA